MLWLLDQVVCPPLILVKHPQPGLQLAYDFQQSFQKIPFPATSLWPGLFQKKMDQILEECQGCIGITDNITVHSCTEAEHDACL